ncbi:very long-chain acyl-CoA synthetase-like [Sinocyclocheilus rhinocerous]|uniref:very long-chain acyl-CoA synthetase-like n=1 Tax=Sinocyclocheilus rhinocerous TaxID=307959 RepID=UPI0007B7EB9A|nr:PREDICTED: very long-chain acyl-CoA synthetase-like [Sinocyclocheilus rhinocerous]
MYVWITLLAGLALLLALLKTFSTYFFQDCVYMYRALGFGIRLNVYKRKTPFYSIVDCFLEAVKKHPRKAFIHFEGKTYSYEEVDKESNKVANALRSEAGLREGDSVALFLGNEPRFVWTWLGLAKLGCPAALLNFNIRSKSLLHCFSCCGAKVLIAAAELRDAVEEILPTLKEKGITVYLLSDERTTDGIQCIGQAIAKASDTPLSPSLRSNIHIRTTALYIYTSGTTGLPKAAYVTHERVWASSFIQGVCGVTSEDIFYINLPLYHSAGFLIGLVGSIERGNTVVLRRKFSASQFWDDCRKYNITVMQYIGETLRYLCNMPKVKAHMVYKYGDICLYNLFLRASLWDSATTKTQTRRLSDVFVKGDLYFNSGDLLRIDKDKFVYFHDRVGDTFRWKGENVATTEVADILTMVDCIEEANVYGVKVEGHEGRIGMAAVKLKEGRGFDCINTCSVLANYLPVYARPRFIRIQNSLEVTGTFKMKKVKLVEEGFDPTLIRDPLYFLDLTQKKYIPLSQEIHKSILSQEIKL